MKRLLLSGQGLCKQPEAWPKGRRLPGPRGSQDRGHTLSPWRGPLRLLKQFDGLPHILCAWTICITSLMPFLASASGRGTELGWAGLPRPRSTSGASAGALETVSCHHRKALPVPASHFLTSGFSFSAFEMTLTEGNKLEKKIFYSTFATVSK